MENFLWYTHIEEKAKALYIMHKVMENRKFILHYVITIYRAYIFHLIFFLKKKKNILHLPMLSWIKIFIIEIIRKRLHDVTSVKSVVIITGIRVYFESQVVAIRVYGFFYICEMNGGKYYVFVVMSLNFILTILNK